MYPTIDFYKMQLMGLSLRTKFQRNQCSRFRDTERGTSGGAHVHAYHTHGLCNMHRHLVLHTPNLVSIGRAIPELWVSGQF